MIEQFPCLGFPALGLCNYNPAQPPNVYFDIGGGITALGFTTAIQQLLRPIYIFRLRAYGIKFWHLTIAILVAFALIMFAAILPSLPISRDYFFAYPIFWEFIGGGIMAIVYGLTAYLILTVARLNNYNIGSFVWSAGQLLSEAAEEDRAKFAMDLLYNIEKLFEYTGIWHTLEWRSTNIEFERLKAKGLEPVIHGRVPISPFLIFTFRKQIDRAQYAGTLFRLLSDPKFCATLVRDCPWLTAEIIRIIAEKKLHTDEADRFIQEIARQAIINEDSLMAREVDYTGFAELPLLSESLFSSPFILKSYRPLNTLSFDSKNILSPTYIARLNSASKMMMKVAIKSHGYWNASYMFDVKHAYEQLSRSLGWSKVSEGDKEYPQIGWHNGIRDLYNILLKSFAKPKYTSKKALFITTPDSIHNYHLVSIISDIIDESFEAIANKFEGRNDRFWHHAIETFMDIFPSSNEAVDGLNPLQQHLAIKWIETLKDNMNGFYPAICRILLAVVGPYEKHDISHRTAFVIFRDAMYIELQKLSELNKTNPDKIKHYLPDNVVYDAVNNSLSHTYRGGKTVVTNLSELSIPDVNLSDEVNWYVQEAPL